MADESKAKKMSIAGAIVAALAASSCCIGPLILAVLGVGGAGAFATLAGYRPYILGVTAVLLAAGFYLTYRQPRAAVGDACGCEKPKANRAGKIGLWIATAFVVLFAAAPSILGAIAERTAPKPIAAASDVVLAKAVLHVEGMDCQACSVHARKELAKVGGFHDLALDVPNRTLTITFEAAPGRLDAYLKSLKELGYEAEITSQTTARIP